MKKIYSLLLLFCALTAWAQQPLHLWVKKIGGTGDSFDPPHLNINSNGDLVCIGNFNGITDCDPGPGTSTVSTPNVNVHTFISKYDPTGNLLWACQLQSSQETFAMGATTDLNNNIYITGYFMGTADFDPGPGSFTLSSSGPSPDIFILKLDATGNFAWAVKMGGSGIQTGLGIATDATGSVYSTGAVTGIIDLDPGPGVYPINSANGSTYVLKLNPSGNFIWAREITNTGPANPNNGVQAEKISIGQGGNIYLNGWFRGVIDADPGAGTYTLSANPSLAAGFALKLDASGNFAWATQIGDGNNSCSCLDIVEDGSGDVCITGGFSDAVDFDPGPASYTLSSGSSSGTYFVKLNSLGGFIWAKHFRGINSSGFSVTNATSICTDDCDAIYTMGSVVDTVDFDPGPATYTLAGGNNSGFISKLDANGNLAWAKPIKTFQFGFAGGCSLKINSAGELYAFGSFIGSLDFDWTSGTDSLLSSDGGFNPDFFLSKINTCDNLCHLAAASSNNTICAGSSAVLTATGGGNYSWVSGPATQSVAVSPTVTTNYTVTATNIQGCSNSVTVTQYVSMCTSLGEQAKYPGLNIYPNPAAGFLFIHSETNEEKQLRVFNVAGQMLLETYIAGDSTIDVKQLPPGLYMIHCKNAGGAGEIIKLIKE